MTLRGLRFFATINVDSGLLGCYTEQAELRVREFRRHSSRASQTLKAKALF
jgi:hypothetical protein